MEISAKSALKDTLSPHATVLNMDTPEAVAMLETLNLAWPGGLESILLPFHTKIASLLTYAVSKYHFPETEYLHRTFCIMVQASSRNGAVQAKCVPVMMTVHELTGADLQRMFSAARLPMSIRAVFADAEFFGGSAVRFGAGGEMALLRLLKARGGVDKIVVEF